mmetsp:Transcript_33914/g.29702  ORF Transcript_33914/g.29702 Transcript_33914/m.29702 type:complete len:206 (+) Transcript_33914:94-711(+)
MAASSTRPTIEDGQVYLDYLAAVQAEQQEILAVFYESELNNPPQNGPLLTDSEILSLFDSGYDVDMIIKAYPEFELKKIKALKRKWSDKQHRHKKKKKKQTHQGHETEEKSNVNRDNSASNQANSNINANNNNNNNNSNDVTPAQTASKRKRRRRAKSKNGNNGNHSNSNTPKNNHKCEWCFKQFGSEKALKQHFKDNPHMHEAI